MKRGLALGGPALGGLALGGVVGPVAFVGAWLTGSLTTSRDSSMIDDAISRLAAVGADSRPLMTAGFVCFGVALTAYALAVRDAVPGRSWIAAAATGVATLAVAALPLDHSDLVDRLHGVAAGIGYVTLALTPALSVAPLRRLGATRLAAGAVVATTVSAIALPLSLVTESTGLFQRVGLTATDLWIVASVPAVRSRLSATS